MNKRFLTAGMAAVLTLSLAIPAFATAVETPNTDGVYKSSDIDITGTVNTPIVKVTVPANGAVILNPFKMEVELVPSSGDMVTDQILSINNLITNESNVAIAVDMIATGKAENNAVFSATKPTATATTNSVYMFVQILESDDTGAPLNSAAFGTYNKANSALLTNGTAVTVKKAVTIPAAAYTGSTMDTPTYAAFKFCGEAVVSPAKAWVAADKVGATVAFTFSPVIIPPSLP